MVTIVLPVYNEQMVIEKNTLEVFNFCNKNLEDDWQVVISDNNSTDKTAEIGKKLAHKYERIKYYFTHNQGKGYGVIEAWQNFPGDIYVFMDADLSTDVESLPRMIEAIKNGADIAAGSRFHHNSEVNRTWPRKFISRSLQLILKISLQLKIQDAPCGFKAVNQKVIDEIIPEIKNRTWFFDTEMIWLAQRKNFKIANIAINWSESERASRVNLLIVIKDYFKNIYQLSRKQ